MTFTERYKRMERVVYRIIQLTGLVTVCAIYVIWTWNDGLGDLWGDNASYLLIARYLSPWNDPTAVVAHFASHSPYPPVYPFLLGLAGADKNIVMAHFVTTAFLLSAFVALYCWLRADGISKTLAYLTSLLFAALPGTYLLALSILSESVYLFFSVAAIGAVAAYETSKDRRWLWGSALCVATAILTRSAGVALLVAYALYLVLSRPRRYSMLIAATVLPFFLWIGLHQSSGADYLSALLEKYGADPVGAFTSHLGIQLSSLWQGWSNSFSTRQAASVFAGMVGVVCVAGTGIRVWQLKFDGFYVLLYLLLIVVWPFPNEAGRFVFVIIPVVLAHGLQLLCTLPTFHVRLFPIRPAYLLLLVCFSVALPDIILTVERFRRPMPDLLTEFRRERAWYEYDVPVAMEVVAFQGALIEAFKKLKLHIAENECVVSIKPSFVGFYAERISVYPPSEYMDSEAFNAWLASSDCRYVFMTIFVSPGYPTPYYPMDRFAGSLQVLGVTTVANDRRPVAILARRIK